MSICSSGKYICSQKHQNTKRLWLAQWKCGPSATSAHVKQHWPMACFLLISWVEDWPWLNSFLLRELHASSWRSKSTVKLRRQSVLHCFLWISMASMVYTPNFNGQGARSSSPDEGIHHLEARPLTTIENRMRSARIYARSHGWKSCVLYPLRLAHSMTLN